MKEVEIRLQDQEAVAFLDLFRHYQLGLAHGFNKQYDDSIDQYRRAIKVMEAKIGIKLLYIVLL